MAASPGADSYFDSDTSPGWRVIQLLLSRRDLDSAARAALVQTCTRTAALTLTKTDGGIIHLTLSDRRRANSFYAASLLDTVQWNPPPGSKATGPNVDLTLCGGVLHCLAGPALSRVKELTLREAGLSSEQWRACVAGLQDYPALKTLRLRKCSVTEKQNLAGAGPCEQCVIEHLDTDSGVLLAPAIRDILGYVGASCKVLTAPTSAFMPWMTSSASFSHGLHTLNLTVDNETALRTCIPLLPRLQSLQHATLDFPTKTVPVDMSPAEAVALPAKPWSCLTLRGYVPYKMLGFVRVHPTTVVNVIGHVVFYPLQQAPQANEAVTAATQMKFLPAPDNAFNAPTRDTLMPASLHLHNPDDLAVQLIMPRLATDVECLTLHCPSVPTRRTHDCLRFIASNLPQHVKSLCVILGSDKPVTLASVPAYPQLPPPVPAQPAQPQQPAPPPQQQQPAPAPQPAQAPPQAQPQAQQLPPNLPPILPPQQPPAAQQPQLAFPGSQHPLLQLLRSPVREYGYWPGLLALPLQLLGDVPLQDNWGAPIVLPSHVTSMAVGLASECLRGSERMRLWTSLLWQLRLQASAPQLRLVLANLTQEGGDAFGQFVWNNCEREYIPQSLSLGGDRVTVQLV